MPNHETNNVTIIGTPANIRRFAAEAFVQPGQPYPRSEETNGRDIPALCFELITPQPENIERGGCGGGAVAGLHMETNEVCWYTWNLDHWGTKWGAYEHSHYELRWLQPYGEEGKVYGRVDLRFETAWSQPTPVFEAIEKRWDVQVHAVTQDEGGFPDVEYGDPYGEEVIRKVTTFEFEDYATVVDEPTEVQG